METLQEHMLKPVDVDVYYSSSRKESLAVKDMASKHIVHAMNKLREKWAVYHLKLEDAARRITMMGGDPGSNASVDLNAVYSDPGALFPVYDSMSDELERRSLAAALKAARGFGTSEDRSPT